jgi:restriction system protein
MTTRSREDDSQTLAGAFIGAAGILGFLASGMPGVLRSSFGLLMLGVMLFLAVFGLIERWSETGRFRRSVVRLIIGGALLFALGYGTGWYFMVYLASMPDLFQFGVREDSGGAIARILRITWPVLIVLVVLAIASTAVQIYGSLRLSRAGIHAIDAMNGETFERRLERLFLSLGYGVERTPYRGDFGADLILTKDGIKTVVQAKRATGKVGVAAIQQAIAAKPYYGCSKAMVVTNREFTPQAQRLAASDAVELWARPLLIQKLLDTRRPNEPIVSALDEQAVLPPARKAVCAVCGKAVTEKVRTYCEAHKERFHGQVYCYDHQRSRVT